MATLTLPRPLLPHQSSSSISTLTGPGPLEPLNPSVISDKHKPVCSSGPDPRQENTPPPSPDRPANCQPRSLLFPPHSYPHVGEDEVQVFRLNPTQLASALEFQSEQPLPEPSGVFPWFHGLHPQNHLQQTFFAQQKRTLRKPPSCFRGITLVKADNDLTTAKLKGAITVPEFMYPDGEEFLVVDPRDGFSVRNFQIQTAKVATVSDIVVYGENDTQVQHVARGVSKAQMRWRDFLKAHGHSIPQYHTFVCTFDFSEFETHFPRLVSINSKSELTGAVLDFVSEERRQMWNATSATEISRNVWMGPTPEHDPAEGNFDILIECSDVARMDTSSLKAIYENPDSFTRPIYLQLPSSGSVLPPSWSHSEAEGLVDVCRWIYRLAHGTYNLPLRNSPPSFGGSRSESDSDIATTETEELESGESTGNLSNRALSILIHCLDGYTELSMLCIAYFSFSMGLPVHDAWLQLHKREKRNFFAYPTDVALLTAISPRLLRESPVSNRRTELEIARVLENEPRWITCLDGSLPSRIFDWMYLGNLGHANNPHLLRAMGITQVLSVGESVSWPDGEERLWAPGSICHIQSVQDNGIDPLTDEFERCLSFIERGREQQTATLVHCRVGVSRSATICIAEVMRHLNISFPRAYCYVRARRLNVIIQPHLRFAYELLKWEEALQRQRQTGVRRELEWGEIAREIALMNKPYAR